jgi:hypothetical protein
MRIKEGGGPMRRVGNGRLIFNPLHVFIMSFCMRWLIFDPKDMQSGERC